MRMKLIINPLSGGKKIETYLPIIKEILGRDNSLSLAMTEKKNSAFQEAEKASAKDYDLIVVCGGDGTMNEVINGVVSSHSSLPIGFVPCGTSNIYALSVGIPLDPVRACEIILKKSIKRIDLGKVGTGNSPRYFVSMAGIGYEAAVIKSLKPDLVRTLGGIPAHLIAGVGELIKHQRIELSITVDGSSWRGFEAIICNGSFYGVSSIIAPEADMADGYLDVIIFKNGRRRDILRYVLGILRGRHIYFKDVEYAKAKKIEIRAPGEVWIQVDGEIMGTLP
ncbi:MAG: diacylglycerol kinase family lipid kinase, partial [Elusimicrobiota bacterium]|nr:diacylglycerol kinase family lipid kinase [Elusimicrobiota bacterium]